MNNLEMCWLGEGKPEIVAGSETSGLHGAREPTVRKPPCVLS